MTRYDPDTLAATLRAASGVDWRLLHAAAEEHLTSAGAVQPFTWVVLRRG